MLITPNSSEVVKYGNQEDTVQTVETRVSWRNIVDDPVEYVEVTSFLYFDKGHGCTVPVCIGAIWYSHNTCGNKTLKHYTMFRQSL